MGAGREKHDGVGAPLEDSLPSDRNQVGFVKPALGLSCNIVFFFKEEHFR